MPLYEYECKACGHRTEVIQRVSDPPLADCPECEGELRRLLSAPAVQFKGSGWYVTDYARKAAKGDGAKEAKTDGGAAAADGGKAEVAKSKDKDKPAAGGDAKKPAAASPSS